jgi:hypothetical protein
MGISIMISPSHPIPKTYEKYFYFNYFNDLIYLL